MIDAAVLSAAIASMAPPHDTFDRGALLVELVRDESLETHAYRDTAVPPRWTIGVGRNLTDVGIRPAETHAMGGLTVQDAMRLGISVNQALYLCNSDIDAACADLDRVFPWWRGLSPVRQRVMLNWCFNMGIGRPASIVPPRRASGMQAFTHTIELIRTGYYMLAANAMVTSLWRKQVGKRVDRLAQMLSTNAAPA